MAKVTLEVPREFGYVILVVVMNWMILLWQMGKVAKARKQFNVKYPTLYDNKDPSEFNCYQRAHQNSLEWNPAFLSFLLISGLFTPISSSIAGIMYNIGRIYHANGYYKGNPHKGLWGLYGLFYLCGATIYSAFKLLNS